MKKEKIRNIIILIVVAIIFTAIGYFIPHKTLHNNKKNSTSTTSSSISKSGKKVKHAVFVHEEGSITSISNNILSVNGTNITLDKGTKIYNGNSLVNMSTLQTGVTVSILGAHTKKGVIAKFIIVL